MKWIAPCLAYLAVALGLFWAHSALGALLGFHTAIVISLLLARPNLPPLASLLKSERLGGVAASLLVGSTSGISLYFLWPYLGIAKDLLTQLEALGLTRATWPVFMTYFVLVNPWLEEYFWRGYLANPSQKPVVIDLVFAGYHSLILLGKTSLPALALALTGLVFGAWFWRQASRTDGGLLAPVLGHMAADLTILITVYRVCIS